MHELLFSPNALPLAVLFKYTLISLPFWLLAGIAITSPIILFSTQLSCATTKRPQYQKLGKQLFSPYFYAMVIIAALPVGFYCTSFSQTPKPILNLETVILFLAPSLLPFILVGCFWKVFQKKPALYTSIQPTVAGLATFIQPFAAILSAYMLFLISHYTYSIEASIQALYNTLFATLALGSFSLQAVIPNFSFQTLPQVVSPESLTIAGSLFFTFLFILFLPFSYALGIIRVLLRRNTDDFGRDYYIFSLQFLAKGAFLSNALSSLILLFFLACFLVQIPPATPLNWAFAGTFIASAIIPCLIWLAIWKSPTPLRYKPGIFLAAILLLIQYALLLTFSPLITYLPI